MSNFDEESVVLNSTKDAVEKCCNGVPDSVKSRFREGGFCKWGGAWLPVLELGPFDVEGNVREMWLAIFHDVSCLVHPFHNPGTIQIQTTHIY